MVWVNRLAHWFYSYVKVMRHFLIWMRAARQHRRQVESAASDRVNLEICAYWWTRQRIHDTLIVLDRYLRLMGEKTIPDSAEPRLESFFPPFVAGIDLTHQGVVDPYSPHHQRDISCFYIAFPSPHWTWEIWLKFYILGNHKTDFNDWWLRYLSGQSPYINATGPYWW